MKAPQFWTDKDSVLGLILAPLGAIYGRIVAKRLRRATPLRTSIPVICVGNLTLGGAGKTPVVIDILDQMRTDGIDAHALSRGYGGSDPGPHRVDPRQDDAARVGDEPLLLAAYAPAWIARDRAQGAQAAQARGAELIVMDDGFQNPSVEKSLSLLVIDAQTGFGNGRIFPAGPLRERPESGLERANGVILIGDGAPPSEVIASSLPILRAWIEPRYSGVELKGTRVFAFAGIGRPEKFFDTLRELGAEIVDQESFGDHQPYSDQLTQRLIQRAAAQDVVAVTTEKDMVRLPKSARGKIWPIMIDLRWQDPDAVTRLLAPVAAIVKDTA